MMQRSNYVQNGSLCMQVFTEQQKEEINSAALEVLERVGVEIHSDQALEVLKKGGAYIDGNRARIPAAMVEKAIRSCPSRVVVGNRDGERVMFLEGNNYYYGAGPTAIYTHDPITGERRLPTLADTARASRVIDALPNIDYQMDFGTITDVKAGLMDVYTFKAMLENSVKPIVHWAYNVKNVKAMVEMGVKVRGSLRALQENPLFIIYTEPVTPLVHEFNALDISMTLAELEIPSIYTPAPQAGVSAPMTMAGTIVVSICESLSGLVCHQLVKEGAPFIMGGVITTMDMSTTQITYGSPEFNILAAGLSEMAHYYKIPMFSTSGCSDSKCCDAQQASEIAHNILMAALSGGNLIHDNGYMESGMATSLQAVVLSDELIGKVKRMMRGIPVDGSTLAVDVIEEVGPGGNFLSEEHTLENYKDEIWFPELHNRQRYDDWKADGGLTMEERARRKAVDLINNYQPAELSSELKQDLNDIVAQLEKETK